MTGSSTSHTAGTAKGPDERQKYTSAGREAQGRLTKPFSTKLQEMVPTDTKSWPSISSMNLYTVGTTKAPTQHQNIQTKLAVSRSAESSVHLSISLMQRLGQLQVSTPPVYSNCQPSGMVQDHTVLIGV